ncbi:hypothetical protein GCM10020360_17550 [Nonlabens tegetincola]
MRRRGAWCAAAVIVMLGVAPAAAHAADPLVPDAALASCLNAMIDPTRPADQQLLVEEIAKIPELLCGSGAHGTIRNLEGLQHATRLRNIENWGSADLSAAGALRPLAGLTGLTRLSVSGTGLTSLDGVQGLTNLATIDASGNQLLHVNELAGLTKLSIVSLANNPTLTDISGLAGADALSQILLQNNAALGGNLDALAGKLNLLVVNINYTGATSLEVFADHPGIANFQAIGNRISSLKGLNRAGSQKITQQAYIAGEPFYAAVGATTYVANLSTPVSLHDGTTPPTTLGTPIVGLTEPAPASPVFRFTFGAASTGVAWGFSEGANGALWFDGTVTNAIERVELIAEAFEFTAGETGEGTPELVNPADGTPSKFPVAVWQLGPDAPAFLSIDPITGVISGVAPETGEHTVTVIARDALGNEITGQVTITVTEGEAPPVTPPGPPVKPPPAPEVTPPPGPSLAAAGATSPALLWVLGAALGAAGLAAVGLAVPWRRLGQRR